MRRFIFLILLFLVAGGVIFYAPGGLLKPLNINENTTTIIIKKGNSTLAISNSLKEQAIIPHTVSFLCGVAFLKLKKQKTELKLSD